MLNLCHSLRLSLWNRFLLLFEYSILSGVEVLNEIFIHQLVITLLFISLSFKVIILFYTDLEAYVHIGLFIFDCIPCFNQDLVLFNVSFQFVGAICVY